MPDNFPAGMEAVLNRYNELVAQERQFQRAESKQRGLLGGVEGAFHAAGTLGTYAYNYARNTLAGYRPNRMFNLPGEKQTQSVAQYNFGHKRDEIGLDLSLEGIAGLFGSGKRTGLTEYTSGKAKPIEQAPGSTSPFMAVMRSKDPVAVDRFLSKHPYTGGQLFGLARYGTDPFSALDLATIPGAFKARKLFQAVSKTETPLQKTKLINDALDAVKSSKDTATFLNSFKSPGKRLERDAIESMFTKGLIFNKKAPFTLKDLTSTKVADEAIVKDVIDIEKQAVDANRVVPDEVTPTMADILQSKKNKKIADEAAVSEVKSSPIKSKIPVTDNTETPLAKTISEGTEPRLNEMLNKRENQVIADFQKSDLKDLGYTDHDIMQLSPQVADDIIFDGIQANAYKELGKAEANVAAKEATNLTQNAGNVNQYANPAQVDRYKLFKNNINESIHKASPKRVEEIRNQIEHDVKFTQKLTAKQSDDLLSIIAKKKLGQVAEEQVDFSGQPINDLRSLLKRNNVDVPRGSNKQQILKIIDEAKKNDNFAARLIKDTKKAEGSLDSLRSVEGVSSIESFKNAKVLTMDNGLTVAWHELDNIPISKEGLSGYDKVTVQGRVVAGGATVKPSYISVTTLSGQKKEMFVDAIGYLAKNKGIAEETIKHEFVHMADKLELFFPKEIQILKRDYGSFEKIAEAYAKSTPIENNTIFQKIQNFFRKLYEAIAGPTSKGTFERLHKGEIFKREAKAIKKIKPTVAPDITKEYFKSTGRSIRTLDEMRSLQKDGSPWGVIDNFRLIKEETPITKQMKKNHIKTLEETMNEADTKGIFMKMFDDVKANGIRQSWHRIITPAMGDKLLLAKDIARKAYNEAIRLGYLAKHAFDSSAEFLIQDLPGKLGRMDSVLGFSVNRETHGLSVYDATGKKVHLYKGSMLENLSKPLEDYLKKTIGKITARDMAEMTKYSDEYVVAKRALAENAEVERALTGVYELLNNPVAKPGISKKLRRVGILKEHQLKKLQFDIIQGSEKGGIDKNILKQWNKLLDKNYKTWSDERLTGAGGDIGDLAYHKGVLAEFEKQGLTDTLQKTADELAKIHKAKIDYAWHKGLISDEAYIALNAKKDYYTPLQRIIDENQLNGGAGNIIHAFAGSAREIKNPFSTTAESVVKWVKAADINEVKASLIDSIELSDLPNIAEQLKEKTAETIKVIRNGDIQHWRFNDKLTGDAVRRIGKTAPGPVNILDQMLRMPAKILRFAVSKSPPFAGRNLIRDSLGRMMISIHGNKKLIDIEAWRAIDSEQMYDFVNAGASFSGWFMKDLEVNFAKQMTRHIHELSKDGKTIVSSWEDVRNLFAKGWDKYDNFLSNGETINRMAEFRDARKFIKSQYPEITDAAADTYAAYHSRRLADFAEVGYISEWINAYIPFFAPAIQGSRVLMKTAMRDPKAFTKNLGWIAVPSIGTYLYNVSVGAGDEYRELPAYRRDFFFNFKIGGMWFTIPKPFELGVLGTMPERMVDSVAGNKNAFDGYFGSLVKGLTPVDESIMLGPAKVLTEVITNKDIFRDRYIRAPWEDGLAPELQKMRSKSSRMGKFVTSIFSPFVDFDPRYVDHILKGTFADYGRLATTVSDIGRTDKAGTGVLQTLARNTGFLRPSSPYGLTALKTIKRQRELGVFQHKAARDFRKVLKKASYAPTIAEKSRLTAESIPIAKKTLKALNIKYPTIKDRLKEIANRRKARELKRQNRNNHRRR